MSFMFGGPSPAASGIWGRIEDIGGNTYIKYGFWTLLLGVAICVVLLTVDYFVPFLPGNPITGPSAMARAGKTFWKSSEAAQNLIVPAAEAPSTTPSVWSASVQFILTDSRPMSMNGNSAFRHIMHRGSNPFGLTSSLAGPSGHAGLQLSDLPPNADPTYVANGLPAVMCPGIMLDPRKNDIHIFVHTMTNDGLVLESATIEDVPLNQPLSIGVISNNKVLEIYVNCRLYDTQLLKGVPYLPAAAQSWYGRYGAFPAQGAVRNLTLWDGALNSSDFMQMCSVGGSFSGVDLSSCATNAQ